MTLSLDLFVCAFPVVITNLKDCRHFTQIELLTGTHMQTTEAADLNVTCCSPDLPTLTSGDGFYTVCRYPLNMLADKSHQSRSCGTPKVCTVVNWPAAGGGSTKPWVKQGGKGSHSRGTGLAWPHEGLTILTIHQAVISHLVLEIKSDNTLLVILGNGNTGIP